MNPEILYPWFKIDILGGGLSLAICFFLLLIIVYSLKFMKGSPHLPQYYAYIIFTAIFSVAALLANNLILLLVFWGILGLILYLLIDIGKNDSSVVAKKTFIIIGAADALMLLGVIIVYQLSKTWQMDKINLSLDSGLAVLAYICIAIGSFAKAGAMPMHSWIPDCAEAAPLPVVAYLPAALDKLLGIYLLARISLDLFVMNEALNIFLMFIGAITIIAAVMMALVQHNMKRLLGYHAVSQVGYMVLGIGTGNPIAIAGGIFHMLNNALYKSSLFLNTGNVEKAVNTTELDKLGGLNKAMPVTYATFIIASLSIAGVPPFNGFFSKWMIYQGIVSQLQVVSPALKTTGTICLVAAMFGSALTLASFMKLIHATFLGPRDNQPAKGQKNREVSWLMWLPSVILTLLCVIFGIFAYQLPLKYFILPVIKEKMEFSGLWQSGLSALLILCGLILGLLIFKLKNLNSALRQDIRFTGAETSGLEGTELSGTDFYNTIKELRVLKRIYKKAEAGFFDLYEQAKRFVFFVSKKFQYLHNGVLPTYLVWFLLGMLVLFYTFILR
ncbi:MAG: hypothetical protein DRP74_04400 [Candidatus Omnitrophota bacterium]|nr:MAG: hypothetical protein DRP74_04400 [Candidatus Omnitrophota bacterium]